jgi:hypothetical protein
MTAIGLSCSLDSFAAAAAMMALGCPARYRMRLAAAFGVCDVAGSLAGAGWHAAFPVLLATDNLLWGMGDGGGLAAALTSGASSGLLAWLGFAVARLACPRRAIKNCRPADAGAGVSPARD